MRRVSAARHRPVDAGGRGRRRCVIALLWLLLAPTAFAAPPSPPDAATIMANVDRMNRPRYEVTRMRMELSGNDGGAQSRELVWRSVNDGSTRTSLFRFTDPASLRGVGTLVVEAEGRPNAIWHYLPATRNVRRIAGEHRQNRFMGTEFVFEDFEGLQLDRYAFDLLRSEACPGNGACYVIEGRPGDAGERAGSGYGRKVFWVDQKTHAIVRIELFDPAGTLAKVHESTDFHAVAGYWRARRQVMTNVRTGRSTVLLELERTVDVPFDKYYVSQQYLRAE
jgi:hypothetical protein